VGARAGGAVAAVLTITREDHGAGNLLANNECIAVQGRQGLARGVARRSRRTLRPLLAGGADHAVVHCGHHKVGTVWFANILRKVADHHGRVFLEIDRIADSSEVYLYQHSEVFDRSHLGGRPFRGTHLIRDPRDVVVSGYFYHLWTDELWATVPRERFDGRSYREELNRVDRSEGLLLEIGLTGSMQLREMLLWDYQQPEFLELRYEELIADEVAGFTRVFEHYGFSPKAIEYGLGVVQAASFHNVTGRSVGDVGQHSHLRSGKPGEWREHFGPEHLERWNEVAGDALIRLGYEGAASAAGA
jgi:hypothetical protein